jgi:glycine/D-amino acid oxidase-like deaminating enzyme/nitrite reductase/ring-hydroxylating ferredoxin subunit
MRSPDAPSYWTGSASSGDTDGTVEPAPLVGTVRTDVAVVGGGIAGLMTAAAVSATGRRVVLLEALDIVAATTGRSTAKVTALHGRTYADLERQRGAGAARVYASANLTGIVDYERLIGRFGIECGWERQDAFTYTVDPARIDAVVAEEQAAARAGLPVASTTEVGLPFEVAAAVRCHDQAQFDPRRFCLGLARGLRGQGVEVHRAARVLTIEEGQPHAVLLDGGRVEADAVVLATQLPMHDPGLFFSKTKPSRSYALAARLRVPAPEGMYLSIDSPSRSVRRVTDDPHVGIFGGPGHQTGEGGDTVEMHEELERWVRRHFEVDAVLHRWSAQDRMPLDDVPFIGPMPRSAPGVFVATGFKKWGFTNAAVAARVLSDLIAGDPNSWAEVFDSRRAPSSKRAITSAVTANAKVVGHFVGDRIRSARPRSIDDLGPGAGGIVDRGGTKVAAYRDDAGRIETVSARCPHMGCLVAWNSAERSWDCPCHGSRFATDGAVIDGPATKPLPPTIDTGKWSADDE